MSTTYRYLIKIAELNEIEIEYSAIHDTIDFM